MEAPSKDQIVQNRRRLRGDAMKLFSSFTRQSLHSQNALSPAIKNSGEVTATAPIVPKSTITKRKVSEDLSVFQNRHRTREISVSLNFNILFETLERLGEGAQSTVRKCKERASGHVYAVKIFRSDVQLRDNLKMQYKILKTLSHENIIEAHYLFVNTKQNTSHMVLDYCEYPSLRETLDREVILSEDQTSLIISKLLTAVTYLHSKGICHRDLKPENILYDRDSGNIKLIDFEVSKAFKSKFVRVDMWTKTGTVQYCAPEIYSGNYNEMIDIWAIGILTFEIICGRYPFNIEYLGDVPAAFDSQVEFPESISHLAKDFIRRCLTRNPLQRPTAKEALPSPYLLAGRTCSPTTSNEKLNRSFDEGSTEWSFCTSIKSPMKYVEEGEEERFLGDDIGIRCFTDQIFEEP